MILGIDFGTSAVKMALLNKNEIVYRERMHKTADVRKLIESLEHSVDSSDISKIVLTGTGVPDLGDEVCGIPIKTVDEFDAVCAGGRFLSKEDRCIVCSVGTGTSFSYADKESHKHVGGSGMGGGLLASLALNMCGYDDVKAFLEIAKEGNLSNSDLKIKDISEGDYNELYGDVTLANMAKVKKETSKADTAASICNLVFENIAVMAYLSDSKYGTGHVVMLGTPCDSHMAKVSFKNVGDLFGIDIIVPDDTAYGVAIGAALLGE